MEDKTDNTTTAPTQLQNLESGDIELNPSEKAEQTKTGLPWFIFFILFNEFGERFCFYGIRVLLNQYLKEGFNMGVTEAKIQVHLFTALIYLTPLLGAVLSDSFLGKYRTILYFSWAYFLGVFFISLFSVPKLLAPFGSFPYWSYYLATTLIAIGSGGIKPCVCSHGGDQIPKGNTIMMDKLFSMFYIIANAGTLISMYLTPFLLHGVKCFGEKCYLLAFGIPTIVFFISIIFFIIGKKYYVVVPPQYEFLPYKCFRICVSAAWKYIKATPTERQNQKHWLKFAEPYYGEEMVEETRLLLKVIVMLFPIIFYWMLYDQSGTEWQNQYELMDHHFLGAIDIPTEASGNINAVLILFLVPLFSHVIYPFFERRGRPISVLERIGMGYFVTIIAFVVSTGLGYWVYAHADKVVIEDNVAVSCIGCVNGTWQFPQWFLLSVGETLLCVTGVQFAYTQVGPKLKASSTSVYVVNVAIANYLVSAFEGAMEGVVEPLNKQWIYIGISTFFFIIFVLLGKFWYVSKEEEDRAKVGLSDEILSDIKN